MIRIYTKINSYEEKAQFKTWVQRIVTNICIDKFRRTKPSVSIDEHDMVFQDNQDVEYEVMSTYVAQDIQDAINKLPEHHRTVIVLRYLQDLSYNEIADCLDLPLNTVKSYLFRARQRITESTTGISERWCDRMKCEEVVEWMHRYLDHDLGEAETAQMLQHVAKCPECAENFSLLRALSRELEELPQVSPKFSLVDAIMPQLDAIDEARKEQSSTIQEMNPVPAAFENLQRSSERKTKQKWLNSMAGRMSMGAAGRGSYIGIRHLGKSA